MPSKNPEKPGTRSIGTILYGHLKALFEKSNKLPQRIMKSPKASMAVRGTEILLHVVKNKSEYQDRLEKGKVINRSYQEVLALDKENALFTQVCCLEGEISLSREGKDQEILTVGQILSFSSQKSDQSKREYTQDAVYGTSKAFGLEF